MTRQTDAVEILVQHQAAALVRHGVPIERAHEEAQRVVDVLLSDLSKLGLHDVLLGVALRRAQVYRLRSQGLKVVVICERLGISKRQAVIDYRAELMRRRQSA